MNKVHLGPKRLYIQCKSCERVHFFLMNRPYAKWECFGCETRWMDQFVPIKKLPRGLDESTIQPINRLPDIEIYIHVPSGKRQSCRDYIAITSEFAGGYAFGSTEQNAIRALKRLYSIRIRELMGDPKRSDG